MKLDEIESGRHDHVEDKTPREIKESAYRRGFQQGVQAAVDMVAHGCDSEDIHQYALRLHDWRFRLGKYAGSRDKEDPPPPSGIFGWGLIG